MKTAIVSFTRKGAELASRLTASLDGDCTHATIPRLASELSLNSYGNLHNWTKTAFASADALVFVGATGIAVRSVAGLLKSKATDPAVVSVDEAGHFAVALVSGHIGGANRLAREIAKFTGGTAVISTATDVRGVLAVDEWAVGNNLVISDLSLAKRISASLLEGLPVSFKSDFPYNGELPDGLVTADAALSIHVTLQDFPPQPNTLLLFPRILSVGIGCRKGVSAPDISAAVASIFADFHLPISAIGKVSSIDIKSAEPGLLEFCRSLGLTLQTYSADALRGVSGSFTPSQFVESITGVDNVCERAAVLGGGCIIVPKQAVSGVTVAIAMPEFTLNFSEDTI